MTRDDLIAALDTLSKREPSPLDNVRAISVHPDRWNEWRGKFETAAPLPFPHMAAFEIITSSLVQKDRGLLLDGKRQLVGIINFTDGKCYFIARKPVSDAFPFPSFNFTEFK